MIAGGSLVSQAVANTEANSSSYTIEGAKEWLAGGYPFATSAEDLAERNTKLKQLLSSLSEGHPDKAPLSYVLGRLEHYQKIQSSLGKCMQDQPLSKPYLERILNGSLGYAQMDCGYGSPTENSLMEFKQIAEKIMKSRTNGEGQSSRETTVDQLRELSRLRALQNIQQLKNQIKSTDRAAFAKHLSERLGEISQELERVKLKVNFDLYQEAARDPRKKVDATQARALFRKESERYHDLYGEMLDSPDGNLVFTPSLIEKIGEPVNDEKIEEVQKRREKPLCRLADGTYVSNRPWDFHRRKECPPESAYKRHELPFVESTDFSAPKHPASIDEATVNAALDEQLAELTDRERSLKDDEGRSEFVDNPSTSSEVPIDDGSARYPLRRLIAEFPVSVGESLMEAPPEALETMLAEICKIASNQGFIDDMTKKTFKALDIALTAGTLATGLGGLALRGGASLAGKAIVRYGLGAGSRRMAVSQSLDKTATQAAQRLAKPAFALGAGADAVAGVQVAMADREASMLDQIISQNPNLDKELALKQRKELTEKYQETRNNAILTGALSSTGALGSLILARSVKKTEDAKVIVDEAQRLMKSGTADDRRLAHSLGELAEGRCP